MLNLIQTYSIEQIIIFIILFVLAIRGVWDLVDWFRNKYTTKFKKDFDKATKDKELEEHFTNCVEQHRVVATKYDELDNKLNNLTEFMTHNFEIINKAMMHDIKQWIIEKHKFYVVQGWINVNDLEMIEYRYKDYTALGGNSTIPTLMKELRALPKHQKD